MNPHVESIKQGLNGLAKQYPDSANMQVVLRHMVGWTKSIIEMIDEIEESRTRNEALKEQNAKLFDDLAGVQSG